ncbi:transporter [bacterium]|nr:transporter [bacterium]
MNTKQKSVKSLIVALGLIDTSVSLGAEGGASHYAPGFYGDFGVAVAPEPGFYLRNDLYHYTGDASGNRFVQSGEIRTNLEFDATMLMFTGLKVTDREIFGGRYAFGAYVPVLYSGLSATLSAGLGSRQLKDDCAILGDPGIIPLSLYWNCGNWNHNLSEIITVPLGTYDVDDDLNGGLNYWSFETAFSTTYLNADSGFEFSAVLGYLYNTENTDTNYQTGQEIHLEVMVNQYLSETIAIGLHGFYYRQISGDSGRGALLGSLKGEASGIGPAFMWSTQFGGLDTVVTARWMHEFDVDQRLEGDHFQLSATLVF